MVETASSITPSSKMAPMYLSLSRLSAKQRIRLESLVYRAARVWGERHMRPHLGALAVLCGPAPWRS